MKEMYSVRKRRESLIAEILVKGIPLCSDFAPS